VPRSASTVVCRASTAGSDRTEAFESLANFFPAQEAAERHPTASDSNDQSRYHLSTSWFGV
jgi:hypothetical protein